MLQSMSIEGVRCFEEHTSIELGQLTVLAGANNTGKSTVIGLILALMQSVEASSGTTLLLQGEWVDLGPFDQLAPARRFSLGLTSAAHDTLWDFAAGPEADRPRAALTRVEGAGFTLTVKDGQILPSEHGTCWMPTLHRIHTDEGSSSLAPYAPSQVRNVGPYRAPPAETSPFRVRGNGPCVGRYGEYAAEVAAASRHLQVDVLPPDGKGQDPESFSRAMDRWWSYILAQPIGIRVEELRRVGFRVEVDTPGANALSFAQIGFGLSQVWPILVAALSSRKGDIILVETPEAHLHPAAQHRIAQLFVALAQRERQVIVETHSEHVLASMSLAVKREELEPKDLVIHYFSQVDGTTTHERVEVDTRGRQLQAPDGFFDQTARELLELLK